ncbi:MAG: nicotinate-nucleotide adenylyltransferase [Calditrichia bacterium]
MIKIGLLGGTFDPVHNGHLIISEYLRDEFELDEFWFIPAKIHPLKDNKTITPVEQRLKMLELAIADNEHFRICEVELQREGVSYTIDTINQILEENREKSPELYFFIGMDNVNELHRWKSPHEILQKSHVVAFGRPGFTPNQSAEEFLPSIQFIHVPLLEISSTFIRNRIHAGKSVRYLIPSSVEKYIRDNGLYR